MLASPLERFCVLVELTHPLPSTSLLPPSSPSRSASLSIRTSTSAAGLPMELSRMWQVMGDVIVETMTRKVVRRAKEC